jgi:hypothetical protein
MRTECLIALITSKTYIHMLIFRVVSKFGTHATSEGIQVI